MTNLLRKKGLFSTFLLTLISIKSHADTMIYVSPTGDDSNSGLQSTSPLKTIEKAKLLARKHKSKQSVTINLMPGDHYLSEPLTLTSKDSGNSNSQITYRSLTAPGSARLVGGQQLKNWHDKDGDGIWQTRVNWQFETLYANGKRVPKARQPNVKDYTQLKRQESDYYRIETSIEGSERFSFNTTAEQFASFSVAQLNQDELQIYLWAGAHDWANQIIPMSFASNSQITLDVPLNPKSYLGHLKKGSRYFVQGAKAFLDAPGEWYYDKQQQQVYYMPISGNPNNEEIYAPKVETLVAIKGDSKDNLVSNVVFDGLTFMISDYRLQNFNTPDIGAITIKNSQNINIKNSRFINLAGNGVGINGINGYTKNISVIGNYFYETGFSGIRARGTPGTNQYSNVKHKFHDNQIEKVAEIATNGAGILIDNCSFCSVTHNKIRNATHYGIEVKGTKHWLIKERFAKQNDQGQFVMPDGVILDDHLNKDSNVYDYNPGRFNTVAYNDVSEVNLDTQDTGIYKSGGTFNTIIDHNKLYNSGANFGIQKGLYLDDVSDYTQITNNIVYGVRSDNPASNSLNVKGIGSEIYNNLFHFINTGARILQFEPKGKSQPTLFNQIKHNIFYSETSTVFYDLVAARFYDKVVNEQGELMLLTASDQNLFYTLATPFDDNSKTVKGIPGPDTLSNWQSIKGINEVYYDQNSVLSTKTSGLFKDPVGGDYRFLESALELADKINFKPIDTSDIGLTPEHIYNAEGELKKPVK